jgi:hypothetical protein
MSALLQAAPESGAGRRPAALPYVTVGRVVGTCSPLCYTWAGTRYGVRLTPWPGVIDWRDWSRFMWIGAGGMGGWV